MEEKKLTELQATAICGNDISSSCLYVSAISVVYAGAYAWLALLIVAAVLYLFRRIYAEVVGALPLNGGAYNVLLNTTSKSNASVAACLTILSYMATAVLSGSEAMYYLSSMIPSVNVLIATVCLLGLFLLLTLGGISESAKVAVVIFITHLCVLSLLVIVATIYIISHGAGDLIDNFSLPTNGSPAKALFFGFSAAMLGISGFESSANFVEEQRKGVFPKTLRNMWIVVSVFNPLLAFLAIAAMPISEVGIHKETLLSHLGHTSSGHWLAFIISIDAIAVLSGAVLTSYVGVNGLIRRMTLDRIWPQFFLRQNRRKSNYPILIAFFILCVSITLITKSQLEPLAGVYTISFLSVMAFFAIGNFLLKAKRAKLYRPVHATAFTVFLALLGVIIALYGNIKIHPDYLVIFLQYFVPAMLLIYAMLNRIAILNFFLHVVKSFSESIRRFSIISRRRISKLIFKINDQEFVFFTKCDDVSILNKVMIYVRENEFTGKLKIVAITSECQKIDEGYMHDMEVLDRAYPDIKIEFITRIGVFGPELIEELSQEWGIPKNFMFIGAPGNTFPYRVSELGGVRLII